MIFCRITDYATSYATLLWHDERGKSHFDNESSELLAIEEIYILSKVANDVSLKLDRLKSFHTYKK
jgi:hypothetical protein